MEFCAFQERGALSLIPILERVETSFLAVAEYVVSSSTTTNLGPLLVLTLYNLYYVHVCTSVQVVKLPKNGCRNT